MDENKPEDFKNIKYKLFTEGPLLAALISKIIILLKYFF